MANTTLNCEQFKNYSNPEYYDLLRNQTYFNATLIELCHSEICFMLAGTGNPDISGIGVYITYIIENSVGFLLGGCIWAWNRLPAKRSPTSNEDKDSAAYAWREFFRKRLHKLLETYYDISTAFAFAIQVACYVLAFGVDLSDIGGGNELIITWLASTTSLLPLIFPFLLLSARSSKTTILVLFAAWLSIFPLVIQYRIMYESTVRPDSMHGPPPPSTDELRILQGVCMPGFKVDNDAVQRGELDPYFVTMETVALFSSWVIIVMLVITPTIVFLSKSLVQWKAKSQQGRKEWRWNLICHPIIEPAAQQDRIEWRWNLSCHPIMELAAFVIPGLLAVPLLVFMSDLRSGQQLVSTSANISYEDNKWGFGQIMAITMYAPIALELYSALVEAFQLVGKRRSARLSAGRLQTS